MSEKRQASETYMDIRSFALECPSGYVITPHSHPWHQLIYGTRGVMTINTEQGSWVVPFRQAVWVPADVTHGIEMHGHVAMRTLYLRTELATDLPQQCRVMQVSPLLRELILRTIEIGMLDRTIAAHRHLVKVILDQLQSISTIPLNLPMPMDPRALRLAELLRSKPDDSRTLGQLAREVGASKRTIERIFQLETEMTIGKWRQQLRLLNALRLLAAGQAVTSVALEVGYDSPSAFISAFKAMLGTTPGQYYAEARADD